ncbi:hypothetical protein K504DRAFT_460865 [Pleomassaria siparia CBS 279.74]|uniref:GPI anchored cell wall protein n=1 Tax=Pleomassaria siparia CBS 279.74 TaxID=1314801 RepID=A0A6G1JXV8_9PLEO|nr:hypothetical protein K504DRAFT_460865 [Pleomassaria siparia CBS 279.74]
MKSFTTIAALAAFLSSTTTSAATVTLQETACLQNNTELQEVTVNVNELVSINLDTVCGLKLTTATDIDINTIVCQAYKDQDGKVKGSAEFTFANPALIATNPVQEGSVLCKSSSNTPQARNTTLPVVTTEVFTTLTSSASAGTGSPTGKGNGTVPTVTGGPSSATSTRSATGTAAPSSGASTVAGMGIGVAGLAFAAFLL